MSILHPQQCGYPDKSCKRCEYEARHSAEYATMEERINAYLTTIERLERELAEAKAAMSRCLLGDPPGDCYAAESITQRVRAERYRKAIDDYLEGNYPCPSAYRGKLGGKCPHGTYYWEECEGCNTEHFEAALKEPSDALGEEDNAAGE